MKSIIEKAESISGSILIVIGISAVVLAFLNSPVQLQLVVGLSGLGFISLGLVQFKSVRDKKKDAVNLNLIQEKLDEIKRELENKEEKPGGTGVAIADIISSGLKYYTEHMNKDEDND
jgi:hypothetical protein